jgi:hypothetical protein
MRRLRFSIASLLIVILFISVALAALRASTDVWDGCLLGLALLLLLTATLLTIHRKNRQQASWLGFSVFGWAYLVASLLPPIETRLPTTNGLAYLGTLRIWPPTAAPAYFDYDDDGTPDPSVARALFYILSTSGSQGNFVRIGHSLLALVMALIGGRLSRWLYDKNHVQMAGRNDLPTEQRRRS